MTLFPYAQLARRFDDPRDRDRFAAVALGRRWSEPEETFRLIAAQCAPKR